MIISVTKINYIRINTNKYGSETVDDWQIPDSSDYDVYNLNKDFSSLK